jgi:RNA polymerase sigma-70 factor (ECF subfamily)
VSGLEPHTTIGGHDQKFPPTQWTLLQNVHQRKAVINELCERYWKPLYGYLRARGWSNDQAKDLVQEFFTEKVLGQGLVEQADRTQGRFRNFLLVALRNYAINYSSKLQNRRGLPLQMVVPEAATGNGPDTLFDRVWAESLLDRILVELKTECHHKGKSSHWSLFEAWVLRGDGEINKMSMSNLCAQLGFPNASQAYKIIFRVKARFRELLRGHFRSHGIPEIEIDAEIRQFIDILSNR